MKVLFVPLNEVLSHVIPLLALNRKLVGSNIETGFIMPRAGHRLFRQTGVNVLDIDHTGLRTEMVAYGQFSPDIVVDDLSLSTGYATALSGMPRVTIQRTGLFPEGKPRNKNHRHSLKAVSIDVKELPDVTFMGLPQPQSVFDLFKANACIVTGVKSIEVLPESLRDHPRYFFSGPLLMDDFLVRDQAQLASGNFSLNDFQEFESLREFLELNKERRVIYMTFGVIARATQTLFDCLRGLLDMGVAIITSIKVDNLSPQQQSSYYHASYLPMHFVCSHADLMIHQCGSGTYHYPLLHEIPAITIGTQCYDREDVALRLQELGTSIHIPAPDECADFIGRFQGAIERYFDESSDFHDETRKNIKKLKIEIEQTSASFEFRQVLDVALDSARRSRKASLAS